MLERRRRLGDSSVVPVLTVRFEPPLTDADCARLEAEHNAATKASWVGSVRIESARVRTDTIELTLAPLTADHVPLETLRRHARVGLSAELAVSFLVDVATAMSGAVHGGLHPRRVVVLADGDVKLVGTRSAGLSRVLAPALTNSEHDVWRAPEQKWGATPDERSDVYALGLLLFWLLSDDLDVPSLVRRARTASHESTIPLEIAEAIMCAVSQDPALRYPDPLAFCQAVTAHVPPTSDRTIITNALRYIIDAGRGGLAAMLGAVEIEAKASADPFSPLADGPAVEDFDALEPEEAADVVAPFALDSRSIAVTVAPVAGFEGAKATETERLSVAPPVELGVPRVITEKSNVETIEERSAPERALPLPVRDVPALMPASPIASAAPVVDVNDYSTAPAEALPRPESHTPKPPSTDLDLDDEPWSPTHLPEASVPAPRRSRLPYALGGAMMGVAVVASLGWAFAPNAERGAEEMHRVAAATVASAPVASPAEVVTAPEPEAPTEDAAASEIVEAEATVVNAEPAGVPLDLMTIMSHPSGATVSIDGRIVGRTPFVTKRALEPREYRVEVRLPGHERWQRMVTPNADHGTISLVAQLVEQAEVKTASAEFPLEP
ncbi:MAG: PEGA domain-containing protein [Deltaproteobacteria bacterium]